MALPELRRVCKRERNGWDEVKVKMFTIFVIVFVVAKAPICIWKKISTYPLTLHAAATVFGAFIHIQSRSFFLSLSLLLLVQLVMQ